MAKPTLLELAMAETSKNIVKGRSGRGGVTYLDRFVKALLDENSKPTEAKSRVELTAAISLDMALEQVEKFSFENEEHVAEFAKINTKVKNQVAAAISDSQNSTSLSFNDKYKEVWTVVKEGGKVRLEAKA